MTVSDKKYDCTTCPYPRYKDDNLSHNAAVPVIGDAVVYGKRLHIELKLFLLGSHKPYLFLHTLHENLHGFQIVV